MVNRTSNYLPNISPTHVSARTTETLLQKVQEIFQTILGIAKEIFPKVWDQALLVHPISWQPGEPLTSEIALSIGKALQETLVYHGVGLQIEPKVGSNPNVDALMKFWLGKGSFSLQWLNPEIIKAIFLAKNPSLLGCKREFLRSVFEECAKTMPRVGSPEEILFQTFVGNGVSLIPYCYPGLGETFAIPQKVGGKWKVCTYSTEPIALTPKGLLTPLFAYGLTSQDAPPMITFSGTTFPAGDGFVASLMSDFTPGLSVGHAPYLLGQKKIAQWLEGKEKVRLFGLSLGGALCFHVLRNHKEKIGEVNAYNPAGLYPWDWKEPFETQKINIYYQENDLVATMGMFPTGSGVTIYRVYGAVTENAFHAHARSYSGSEITTILKSSPEYENSRLIRRVLTGLHLVGCLTVFPALMALLAILSYKKARSLLSLSFIH